MYAPGLLGAYRHKDEQGCATELKIDLVALQWFPTRTV